MGTSHWHFIRSRYSLVDPLGLVHIRQDQRPRQYYVRQLRLRCLDPSYCLVLVFFRSHYS